MHSSDRDVKNIIKLINFTFRLDFVIICVKSLSTHGQTRRPARPYVWGLLLVSSEARKRRRAGAARSRATAFISTNIIFILSTNVRD